MEQAKKFIKTLFSIKPDESKIDKNQEFIIRLGIEIDVETEKLFKKFNSSIESIKRVIYNKKVSPEIIRELLEVEPNEIIIQTNILLSKTSFNPELMQFILNWKGMFYDNCQNIINSYRNSKFKSSTIELIELINLFEDSKKNLYIGMRKLHQ